MNCFKNYYVHVCVHTYSNSVKTSFLTKKKKRERRKKEEIKTIQNVGYVLLTTWMYFGPQADKHSTILENTMKCSGKCQAAA